MYNFFLYYYLLFIRLRYETDTLCVSDIVPAVRTEAVY